MLSYTFSLGLRAVGQVSPQIETLLLSNCSNISVEAARTVELSLPNLKHIQTLGLLSERRVLIFKLLLLLLLMFKRKFVRYLLNYISGFPELLQFSSSSSSSSPTKKLGPLSLALLFPPRLLVKILIVYNQ